MTTRPLYSSDSSCRIGAIFLQGMHVPAPKSRSFGRGILAISFGIFRSVEDCAKHAWCENKSMKRINNLINEMKRKLRFFLLMNYFSSKARTIRPLAAWSSCGLRHCFRNKSASSLSSSRRILFNLNVSSGASFSMIESIVILLSPFNCSILAKGVFLRRLIRSLKDRHSMVPCCLIQLRFEALFEKEEGLSFVFIEEDSRQPQCFFRT